MKSTTIFLILFTCCQFSMAQLSEEESFQIDSLNAIIDNKNSHDTLLAKAYLELSNILYQIDFDTIAPLCNKVIEIAEPALGKTSSAKEKKSYLTTLSGALNNLGVLYESKGEIILALDKLKKAVEIYKSLNDEEGLASVLNNLGIIYQEQGDVATAINYFHQALKIDEQSGNKEELSVSLSNIGLIYFHQEEYDLAEEYYKKALALEKELHDIAGQGGSLNNIGVLHRKRTEPEEALIYFQEALKLFESINNKRGIAETIGHIAGTYDDIGEVDKALEYLLQSLEIKRSLGDKNGISSVMGYISRMYLKKDNVKEARSYARQSYEIAQELGNAIRIRQAAGSLKLIEEHEGNYEEALAMYELHIKMRDSLKNQENQKAAIKAQTKYEFEKEMLVKEQEEQELLRLEAEKTRRRNNLQYSVILVAIVAVFGVVLSLGFVKGSARLAEGLIFFAFLIFFEFLLILTDPYIEGLTAGAPAYKLLANAFLAAAVFPAHAFFEKNLKKRIVK